MKIEQRLHRAIKGQIKAMRDLVDGTPANLPWVKKLSSKETQTAICSDVAKHAQYIVELNSLLQQHADPTRPDVTEEDMVDIA